MIEQAMAYVLKNSEGQIVACSTILMPENNWLEVQDGDPEYLAYLETTLQKKDAFRESDIQLARVLEDLIEILISRNLISFTDFPSAAQKRLNERQAMRHRNRLSILDDDELKWPSFKR
jgi:hypothetical protein